MKTRNILVTSAFTAAALLAVCISVVYCGDDFYYLMLPKSTGGFVMSGVYTWLNDNGRFIVHALDTVILSLNLWVWRVFMVLMTAAFVYFGMKACNKSGIIHCCIIFAGILSIGVGISRQSVFWVTGSLNYVFPLVLETVYIYLLFTPHRTRTVNIMTGIIAFITGASQEQAAAAAISSCIIAIAVVLKNTGIHHLTKKQVIMYFCLTVIGALTLFLAPGSFKRMELENTGTGIFSILFANCRRIISATVYYSYSKPYIIAVTAACACYLVYCSLNSRMAKNRRVGTVSAVSILTAAAIALFIHDQPGDNVSVTKIFSCVVFAAMLCISVIISHSKTAWVFSAAAAASFGIMLFSASVGPRNYLMPLLFMVYFVISIIPEMKIGKFVKIIYICTCVLLCLIALRKEYYLVNGYASNVPVFRENETLIREYVQTDNTHDTIFLKKAPETDYEWSPPYSSQYHTYYYRMYYGLPKGVEIVWS